MSPHRPPHTEMKSVRPVSVLAEYGVGADYQTTSPRSDRNALRPLSPVLAAGEFLVGAA